MKCEERNATYECTGLGNAKPGDKSVLYIQYSWLVGADRRLLVCLFVVIQMKAAGLASSGHMPTRVVI